MHEKYASKGLACVSASIDSVDDQHLVLRFLQQHDALFTNLLLDERQNERFGFFDIYGVPAMMVYDRAGKVAARFNHNNPAKSFTHKDVEEFVVKLLAN